MSKLILPTKSSAVDKTQKSPARVDVSYPEYALHVCNCVLLKVAYPNIKWHL